MKSKTLKHWNCENKLTCNDVIGKIKIQATETCYFSSSMFYANWLERVRFRCLCTFEVFFVFARAESDPIVIGIDKEVEEESLTKGGTEEWELVEELDAIDWTSSTLLIPAGFDFSTYH